MYLAFAAYSRYLRYRNWGLAQQYVKKGVGPRPNLLILLILSVLIWGDPALATRNPTSLQRGAKLYMNYCSGCHALKYMRYNEMAKGLGLTTFSGEVNTDVLTQNLIFTEARIYDPIQIGLPPKAAAQWFGIVPPDLSLVARARGADWIQAFLKGFYEDKKRPFQSNNLIFPDVGMPDVLYPLRGQMVLRSHGSTPDLVSLKPGLMTREEFDQAIQDIVHFLVYVGEPGREERWGMGIGVLGFLAILLILLVKLKHLYWKRLK